MEKKKRKTLIARNERAREEARGGKEEGGVGGTERGKRKEQIKEGRREREERKGRRKGRGAGKTGRKGEN